jgi:hypothetical protein
MNSYKTFCLVMFFIFFYSCKKNEKTNSLKMNIDLIVRENDSINVYYTTNRSIEFNDLQSFWTKVEGSKKNQKIQIAFPDSIQPRQLRLDFGRNINQPEIIVNEVKFTYKDKSFDAKGKEVYYLFRVDDSNTTVNKLTGSLERKERSQLMGPSLYPNGDKLYQKLNHLYSEKPQK